MPKRKPLSNITNLVTNKPFFSTTKSNDTSIGSNNADALNPRFRPQSSKSPDNSVEIDCGDSKTARVHSRRPSVAKAKYKGKAVAVVPFSLPPAGRTKTIWDEEEKDRSDRKKLDKGHSGVCLSKTCTVSSPKRKKASKLMPPDFPEEASSDVLELIRGSKTWKAIDLSSKDLQKKQCSLTNEQHAMYIEEQRAYFSEIDAFVLLEEVASESESE